MRDIEWPQPLVDELASRRGLVFLGAGASMSCVSPEGDSFPGWSGLLDAVAVSVPDADRPAYEELIGRHRLLDAAQILTDRVPTASFHSALLRKLKTKKIKPSTLYESISIIDQPVVLTTNYDLMYEDYWDSLDPADGEARQLMLSDPTDSHLVDHLRAGRRLLIKLHGTISTPHEIVLSRSSYAKSWTENAEFYRVISALMLTRTMFFVGCGFGGDPDIDLLLEDSAFTARSEYPHYAMVPSGQHPSLLRSLRSSYNIEAIEYEARGSDHSDLLAHLAQLADIVESQPSRI